jgi:hypothetical protein
MPAKKTNRKRRSGTGTDPEKKRERLEARRQARAEAMAAQRRAERRRRFIRIGLLVGAGGLVAGFLYSQIFGGTRAIAGHQIETFDQSGVGQHVAGNVDYETTPPVAGPHAATPEACGTHAQPIRDEAMVHTLEHGAVGILYKPNVPVDEIKAVEDIVGSRESHVFSAPYPGMDPAIAVVSWGRMMRLDELDDDAVRQYIEEFTGQGPEDQECPAVQTDSFEPPAGQGGPKDKGAS